MNKTEQEILKEFEKIGLEVIENTEEVLVFRSTLQKFSFDERYTLTISKEAMHFFPKDDCAITVDECFLLCELFKCWGWLDEIKDQYGIERGKEDE